MKSREHREMNAQWNPFKSVFIQLKINKICIFSFLNKPCSTVFPSSHIISNIYGK